MSQLPSLLPFGSSAFALPLFAAGTILVLWAVTARILFRSPLHNISGPAPASWWKGNLGYFFDRHGWWFLDSLNAYDGVARIDGLFGSKLLYVFDPLALQHIVTKEQQSFDPTSWFMHSQLFMFGPGLLATQGDHHRKQRKMLNPVFSIAHMRDITPIFYEIAHKLRNAITVQVKESPKDIDVLQWMGRTALELIGQGGLGYSFDPLIENIPNKYGDAMKALIPTAFSIGPLRFLTHYGAYINKLSFKRTIVENVPWRTFQKLLKIVDSINFLTREVYTTKKTALANGDETVKEQVGRGKDIMSILLKANMFASDQDRLDEEELLAQMNTLVFAATDTTTGALTQILQLLAEHPHVQDKLRAEINAATTDGEISYDDLVSLPYMDAICRETLRLHPPVPFVWRQANHTTVLPVSQPIKGNDGTMLGEVTIPRGTVVVVAIRACNRNKSIWGEDALEWKPERWLSSLPDAVVNSRVPGVYANLMTFFGGGRSCIGFKFSQLEMKVVLTELIGSFKFSMPETVKEEIVWNLASVKYPTVGSESVKPAFPMKVECLVKA